MPKWDHNSIKMGQQARETDTYTEYKQFIQIESGDPYAYFRLQRCGKMYPPTTAFYNQADSEGFHGIVTSGCPMVEKDVAKIVLNEQNRYAVLAFATAWLENNVDFPIVY
jgi:hypothetical protein